MLLDASGGGTGNGNAIIQWPYNGVANQVWRFQHLGGGRYKITGAPSGRVLDVAAGAKQDGSKVHLWDYVRGRSNQIWQVTPVDHHFFRLCPTHAPASCLDVRGASKAKGAEIYLWRYAERANQQWTLLPR